MKKIITFLFLLSCIAVQAQLSPINFSRPVNITNVNLTLVDGNLIASNYNFSLTNSNITITNGNINITNGNVYVGGNSLVSGTQYVGNLVVGGTQEINGVFILNGGSVITNIDMLSHTSNKTFTITSMAQFTNTLYALERNLSGNIITFNFAPGLYVPDNTINIQSFYNGSITINGPTVAFDNTSIKKTLFGCANSDIVLKFQSVIFNIVEPVLPVLYYGITTYDVRSVIFYDCNFQGALGRGGGGKVIYIQAGYGDIRISSCLSSGGNIVLSSGDGAKIHVQNMTASGIWPQFAYWLSGDSCMFIGSSSGWSYNGHPDAMAGILTRNVNSGGLVVYLNTVYTSP